MRVQRVRNAYDALKPQLYYAGTHLVNYDPAHYQKMAIAKAKAEEQRAQQLSSVSFDDVLQTTVNTEKNSNATEKDLLNRLNYVTGVHFSQTNKLTSGS